MIIVTKFLLTSKRKEFKKEIEKYNKQVEKAIKIAEEHYVENREDLTEGILDICGVLLEDGENGKIFTCVMIKCYETHFQLKVINEGYCLFFQNYKELPSKNDLINELEGLYIYSNLN